MAKYRVRCFEGSSYQEATYLYERWLHTIGSEPNVKVLSVKYDKDPAFDSETKVKYYVLVRYKQEGEIEHTVTPRPLKPFKYLSSDIGPPRL